MPKYSLQSREIRPEYVLKYHYNNYENMSEDEKEWAKIIIPSFMKALCRMDNEVNRGERKGGNTFTIAEIHKEAVLKSFPPANVAKIIKGYGMVKDPFIDVDKDDKVTLTNKGRTWCSEPDEAESLLV